MNSWVWFPIEDATNGLLGTAELDFIKSYLAISLLAPQLHLNEIQLPNRTMQFFMMLIL
jgi:hypothetical protein